MVVVNADWQAQRAALEALAAGRPAVAVRGCGAEDLGAGDLVQLHDGDANSQADAILAAAALAADPATLARCVSVAERHSWDVVSDDLSAIHDQVLRRAPVTA